MGLVKAFSGAIGGTFADQWKDIITVAPFEERTLVAPGYLKSSNRGRGSNFYGSEGVITNGSKIYVPENTAAFIFSQAGIEDIITEPGGYEYKNGTASVFNNDGIKKSIVSQTKKRIQYGGITDEDKRVAFVNLRELRGIKFGTRGAQPYNDVFYGTDLEVFAYGSFSIQVTDPKKLIKNFVPANVDYCSLDDQESKAQILSDFLQSFTSALNSLSGEYRISQLISKTNLITKRITEDINDVGEWEKRFGLRLVKVSIENIALSEDSKKLINSYSAKKMNMKAYDDISQRTSDIAAQQKIASGIKKNGFGNGPAGMLFGMNMVQSMNTNGGKNMPTMSVDEQVETLKKLKDLLDSGILTQEEFNAKKREIMGL